MWIREKKNAGEHQKASFDYSIETSETVSSLAPFKSEELSKLLILPRQKQAASGEGEFLKVNWTLEPININVNVEGRQRSANEAQSWKIYLKPCFKKDMTATT